MSQKHSEQYKIIGQAIKKYRKQRGLTQEQLADRVSISISYLTKIEAPNCDQPFSLEVIFDIAEVLEIHMYYWRIYNFVTEMRFAVRKSTAFVKNKKRKHCKINVSASYMRAADGNRTRDLRTTNATLYRLSHSSIT